MIRYFNRRPQYHPLAFSSSDADMTKPTCLPKLASNLKRFPKLAVIIAALVNKPSLTPTEMLHANIAMVKNFAGLISQVKFRQVIYLSSVDVYGHNKLKLPLSEVSYLHPENPYARSKLISEKILASACRRQKIPITILRLPGVYGPGDKSNRIIPSILKVIEHGSKLTIKGDGEQRRDLLYVEDIARLCERIIKLRISGTFNAVTGKAHSLNEIVRIAETISRKKLRRKYQPASIKQYDLYFKPSLILKYLRYFSFTASPEGLRLTMSD